MSSRLPLNSIILLFGFNSNKNTANVLAYTNRKEFKQESPIHVGRISFTYDKNKLRPYRYEELRGNSYRFLKANDAVSLLKSAKLIVMTPYDKPRNTQEYLEFFDTKKILRPKIMNICKFCHKEDKRLTKLTKQSTYDLFGKEVCRNCAINEVEDEYNRRGIPITPSAKKFYNEQINRTRSVKKVVSMLWEPVNVSLDSSSSLFDTIPADRESSPSSFRKYLTQYNFVTYFDKDLVTHWTKIGMHKLLPVQKLAIESGLMDRRDLLIVAGTSSGKTFVGELVGVNTWKTNNQKFVFVTPLVALSNQKYEEFKKKYRPIGARVALRVGMSKIEVGEDDKIFPDGNFAKSDIVVATFEALDWIIRSGQWKNLGEIGTFVIDEVQLLGDEERGVTVDGLISRIRMIYPKCQIICLSATVGNPEGLAVELGLHPVLYMNRPVPLERHLVLTATEEERIDVITNLVNQDSRITSSSNHHGQSLIFTNTRRRVQELSSILKSAGIKSAYYHAGMTYPQRKRIELRFIRGELDAVTTTAALGAGADFPVSQVIFEKP
ncbi:MAG: DEAD/DEAH box helicase, partial [Candidatus Kariarchaeaceae archaeon]